jgi:phosphoribosylaminoimidazole-succinocarboxamide synthase
MRILLQFPEGLKQFAQEHAKKYEEEGHEVFLSGSSCYGACDLALDEAKAINADKIIHFGHSKFIRSDLPIEVEYVEHHIDVDLEKFKVAANQLEYSSVALATTIQHIHQLDEMKKILEEEGKSVFIGTGNLAFYPGQILGCDSGAVLSVIEKADAVVFVGDGAFHALAINIDKPVYVIQPKSGNLRQINDELNKLKKKRKGAILAAVDSKNFGILVSIKPGQFNQKTANEIKKQIESFGNGANILVANEISGLALNNFMSFDCYITTACPRISEDTEMFGKPVLNLSMYVEYVKIIKEMKGRKMETITKTDLDIPFLRKGKVRETYQLDNNLLLVSSDRLSAFDVVFNEGIPHKGDVLNSLSIFWFNRTTDIVKNHFITNAIPAKLPNYLQQRSMIVKKADPIKLECVVRGYLTGSGWKEYQKSGTVCGIKLPEGLKNGSELPQPIFTPSTKADIGHDENITGDQAKEIVGQDTFNILKKKSLELYNFGKTHARKCGLILADTKFEFGFFTNGSGQKTIILIDEILTPDSSRYWLKKEYDEGKLVSLDKQFVRDYLEQTDWNKEPPAPELPEEVIKKTSERYLQAYKMLTGKDLV